MIHTECTTQAEADAAAVAGEVIVWRAGALILRGSSHAHLHDSSVAHLYGSSHAHLHDNSSAALYESSHATLSGSSIAYLRGSSVAYLYDSSVATLRDGSVATLSGSSRATLYESSHTYLYDSSVAVDGLTGATLRRDRPRIILGPLGSRHTTLGVSLPADGSEPIVYAGCWSGWLSEFAARVDEVYPTGRYGDEYRATIAYIRAIAAIPQGGA